MKNEPTCKKERMLFMVTHYGNPVWRLLNPDGTYKPGESSGEFALYPTSDEAEKKLNQMKMSFPSYAAGYKIMPIFTRVFDAEGRDRPQFEDGWNDNVRLVNDEGEEVV